MISIILSMIRRSDTKNGKTNTTWKKTDLYVNPIGLGTNAVGGHNLYPNLDEEAGKRASSNSIK
ncbi:hypothetical protein GCM10020331_085170 [Ectobacillus funiculus]